MRTALAKAGFVVAAAEYRTVPTKYPALVNDAKAAVRFLREHAKEYGIDLEKIKCPERPTVRSSLIKAIF